MSQLIPGHEADQAAADGPEGDGQAVPEFFLAQLPVKVEHRVVQQDAEQQTGAEADDGAGHAAEHAAGQEADDAAAQGGQARDDLHHDLLGVQIVPVEEHVLDREVHGQRGLVAFGAARVRGRAGVLSLAAARAARLLRAAAGRAFPGGFGFLLHLIRDQPVDLVELHQLALGLQHGLVQAVEALDRVLQHVRDVAEGIRRIRVEVEIELSGHNDPCFPSCN